MRCPVDHVSVTQEFGSHKGVDLGWVAEKYKGQPVYAVDDGVVIYNRYQKTGGYVIQIKHDNGFVSEYGHLEKDSQTILEGYKVKKGQKIANMGNSGYYKKNGKWMRVNMHLHFGLYKGSRIFYGITSRFINPLKYLNLYDGQTAYNSNAKTINHTVHVTAQDGLNIRKGRGTNYKIVRIAKYGEELENYGQKNGWLCVDNIRGYYVSAKWVK